MAAVLVGINGRLPLPILTSHCANAQFLNFCVCPTLPFLEFGLWHLTLSTYLGVVLSSPV